MEWKWNTHLFRIEQRRFVNHALNATHAAISHVNGDSAQWLRAKFLLDLFHLFLLLRDDFRKPLLEGLWHVRNT